MSRRICVIYNPVARGGKAKRFLKHRDWFEHGTIFKPTDAPHAATRIAAEAIDEGFETIVAAGGDGTLSEVLNGFGLAADGFKKARLAVIPLGTVNVFAKELELPMNLRRCWEVIEAGKERLIDVGVAEFERAGKPEKRFFVQLGGAGLDARAIELVNWEQKKKLLQLAYVIAGLKALREPQPEITCEANGKIHRGGLVLFGNGKFYGGRLPIFPHADLADGLLHVCIFEKVNLWVVARYGLGFLTGNAHPPSSVHYLQTNRFKLNSRTKTPFELEGDLVGHLGITASIHGEKLRVVVP
jgi:YegS/Rv2252/BmrU family lipid kinase